VSVSKSQSGTGREDSRTEGRGWQKVGERAGERAGKRAGKKTGVAGKEGRWEGEGRWQARGQGMAGRGQEGEKARAQSRLRGSVTPLTMQLESSLTDGRMPSPTSVSR